LTVATPHGEEFDAQIVHTVAEVEEAAWDRLAHRQPYASHRWYRYGETVLSGCKPLYIILSQRGEAVARATFWLTSQEPLPISAKPLRWFMGHILRRRPLLVCRSPLVSQSGLILPPDPALRDRALQAICRAAAAQAKRYRASFLLFVYQCQPNLAWRGWPEESLIAQLPGPGARLQIQWDNFEDYLRQCLSRMGRKSYRTNSKRAAELGAVIQARERVSDPDAALRLINNVYRRYNTPLESWLRPMMAHAHLVDAAWMTAELDGRLVACELMIGDGPHRALTALGVEDNLPYVYFQLFYEDIRYAIEHGVRELYAGSGAYDVKRRMGFEIVPNNHAVFIGLTPGLTALGRWIAAKEGRQPLTT
jgi:predicted N-acyltransferase